MDIAQTVMASLGRTVNFCLLYLAVMIGTIFVVVGIFKLIAWVADRRRAKEWADDVPSSSNGKTPGFGPGNAGSTPAGGSENDDNGFW